MKLTEAQRRVIEKANKPGGVVGFGRKSSTVSALRRLGLLTPNRDNYGYCITTDAGRAALEERGDA